MDKRALGIFDSGVGGLTVVREVMKELPNEQIYYFGDTARVPYGNKSSHTVQKYSKEITQFLKEREVKAILIACNTSSAVALEEVKKIFAGPVIGVIEPGIKCTIRSSKNGIVGVIGTRRTIESKVYERGILEIAPNFKVYQKACPLFVPLVEEGLFSGSLTEEVVKYYLDSLLEKGIDTLLLGCTHYPLLKDVIKKIVGNSVYVVDSSKEVASEIKRLLIEKDMLSNGQQKKKHRFWVSDAISEFKTIGEKLFKINFSNIELEEHGFSWSLAMYKRIQNIHFVGIGGIGMSGIAEVLLTLGYKVSGSDISESPLINRLKNLGAKIFIGHSKENIEGADVVVLSSAIKPDNIEVISAHKALIPVISRAEMLAEIMRMKYGIAIAGSHGKTTTTSMIATILDAGGLDPTFVIGGRLSIFGSNAKLGQGDFLVAEADESDGSFLYLSPTIAVVTNIDYEHMDYYKDISQIKEAFISFINKIPFYGVALLCLDDKNVASIIPKVKKRYLTYGMNVQADISAENIVFKENYSSFDVIFKGNFLGNIKMQVPGMHNIYNALASIGVALDLGIKKEKIFYALEKFTNAERRFQIKGEVNQILVIDDYGHHPSEIEATLSCAKKGWKRKIITIFQPHRYTRSALLKNQFATAFYSSDTLIVTEIYPAGEKPIEGITGYTLYKEIKDHGHKDVIYLPKKEEITKYVLEIVKQGDMIITLGAGDIWKISEEILEKLKEL